MLLNSLTFMLNIKKFISQACFSSSCCFPIAAPLKVSFVFISLSYSLDGFVTSYFYFHSILMSSAFFPCFMQVKSSDCLHCITFLFIWCMVCLISFFGGILYNDIFLGFYISLQVKNNCDLVNGKKCL